MIETLTLAELCRSQASLVLTPGDPVAEAIAAMGERRLSAVVIVAGERPVGIFTERDALVLIATATLQPQHPLG